MGLPIFHDLSKCAQQIVNRKKAKAEPLINFGSLRISKELILKYVLRYHFPTNPSIMVQDVDAVLTPLENIQ